MKKIREVPGYDGAYWVSADGEVFKRMKPRKRTDGYLSVALKKGVTRSSAGEVRSVSVHRLVAELFIGQAPDGRPHVDHKNRSRSDNRAENLRWASPSENSSNRRAYNPWVNRKPPDRLVLAVRMLADGIPRSEIVEATGYTRKTLEAIAQGRRGKTAHALIGNKAALVAGG